MSTPDTRLSPVLVTLLRGVLYRDQDPEPWQGLLELQGRVRDHLAVLGLDLVVDEAEGCSYVRQREPAEGDPELPRLVARRPLSFPVSLLLAILRKKLAEIDAAGGDTRLILSRDQIAEAMRVFLPDSANEARAADRIDAHVNKAVDLGFLRRLRGRDEQFEVRRLLRVFVDAQWLADFDRRLEEYRAHATSPSPREEEAEAR